MDGSWCIRKNPSLSGGNFCNHAQERVYSDTGRIPCIPFNLVSCRTDQFIMINIPGCKVDLLFSHNDKLGLRHQPWAGPSFL